MSDIKTVRAYSRLESVSKDRDLWQRRFEYLTKLTPRAFAELQQLGETTGWPITRLVDAWVEQN